MLNLYFSVCYLFAFCFLFSNILHPILGLPILQKGSSVATFKIFVNKHMSTMSNPLNGSASPQPFTVDALILLKQLDLTTVMDWDSWLKEPLKHHTSFSGKRFLFTFNNAWPVNLWKTWYCLQQVSYQYICLWDLMSRVLLFFSGSSARKWPGSTTTL